MSKPTVKEIVNDINVAFNSENNLSLSIDPKEDKIIILSDLHRGIKDVKDDFRNSEKSYIKALNYYLTHNYRLILLGDIEELWENNNFEQINQKYPEVYSLEKQFFDRNEQFPNTYIRCYGNHDYRYAYKHWISKDFGINSSHYLKGIKIYEGIKLELKMAFDSMHFYITHGHQGHYKRDESTISKPRITLWGKFQKVLSSFTKNGFYTNQSVFQEPLLRKSDRKMTKEGFLTWAMKNKKSVIYGHTHEAVFKSKRILDGQVIHINQLESNTNSSYSSYNTGCCSYKDGVITGIEIANNKIRLIFWNEKSRFPETIQFNDDSSLFAEMRFEEFEI